METKTYSVVHIYQEIVKKIYSLQEEMKELPADTSAPYTSTLSAL